MKKMKRVFAALALAASLTAGMAGSAVAAGVNSPIVAPIPEKKPTVITVKKTSATTSTKTSYFNLGVKTSDGSKATYKSSTSKVKVSATGRVTVAKNFVGTAKITIKANGVTKVVIVTITPKATKVKTPVSTRKGTMKVTWTANKKASGYKIQYSKYKSFKSAKTKTIKGYKTTSKELTKLKKGTYYVRIQTYKTVNGKKICSGWSTAKKVKVK